MTILAAVIMATLALITVGSVMSSKGLAVRRAVVLAVLVLSLVPSYGPSAELVLGIHIALICVMVLALARAGSVRTLSDSRVRLSAFVFLAYMAASESVGAGIGHMATEWMRIVFIVLLCASVMKDDVRRDLTVLKTVAWLLPVEAVIALMEQRASWANAWPRGEVAFDDISRRSNELIPFLSGRSLGTFGHPILLGTFALVALVACIVLFRVTREKRYLVLLPLSVVVLGLSGTRSAAVAYVLIIALVFAAAPGRLRALRMALVGLGAAVITSWNVVGILGFEGVEETSSYLHRSRILASIPRLLDRDIATTIFGSGGSSGGELFNSGTLSGYPGYYFFDNQYVRILAFAGLLGLVLLVLAVVRTLRTRDVASRLLVVALGVMMASYDVLTWDFSFAILALAISVPLGLRSDSGVVDSLLDQVVEEHPERRVILSEKSMRPGVRRPPGRNLPTNAGRR